MTDIRPTAAPRVFPFSGHRTLAEADRDERWLRTQSAPAHPRKEPRHGR